MSSPDEFHVAPRPCNTCPYRVDTPAGIWHPEEYAKLAAYDRDPLLLAVFRCHQQTATGVPTACRGWLTVHSETVAVRLTVARRQVTPEQVYAEPEVELYETGVKACVAGMRGVRRPSSEARKVMAKLVDKGIGS